MAYLGTCMGRLIDPLSNDIRNSPKDILFAECIGAISRKNRYNGHTCEPYTVGHHVLVLLAIVDELAESFGGGRGEFLDLYNAVLYHDFHEAFSGDMPRPLKAVLPEYCAFEKKIAQQVAEVFGTDKLLPRVKEMLNYLDGEICSAFEMPKFKVGFYNKQPEDTLLARRTSMRKMFYGMSYRVYCSPKEIIPTCDDHFLDHLLNKLDTICCLDHLEIQQQLVAARLTSEFRTRKLIEELEAEIEEAIGEPKAEFYGEKNE